jgi:hypothetical protein
MFLIRVRVRDICLALLSILYPDLEGFPVRARVSEFSGSSSSGGWL